VKCILKVEDYNQFLGQVGHGSMEEGQLIIASHIQVKAEVSKVAVKRNI